MKTNSVLLFAAAAFVAIFASSAFGQGIMNDSGQGSVVPPINSFQINWGIDSGISSFTNGQQAVSTSSPMQFGNNPTASWTIDVTLNADSQTATVTAQSPYLSGAFNWQIVFPDANQALIYSLLVGVSYGANNGETITVSDVSYNNGVPDPGSITAGPGQPFEMMQIDGGSTPITQYQFDLTADTLSSWERNPGSLVLSTGTTIQAVPEPGVTILGVFGGVSLFLYHRKKLQ